MQFLQKLFPEWEFHLSKQCEEKWESLEEQTFRNVHIGAANLHPLWGVITPSGELKKLRIVGEKIDRLMVDGVDPFWTLPKHPDKHFDNVFYYNKPPWCFYCLRRPLTRRALIVLIMYGPTKITDLRAELMDAIARATIEDDALQH